MLRNLFSRSQCGVWQTVPIPVPQGGHPFRPLSLMQDPVYHVFRNLFSFLPLMSFFVMLYGLRNLGASDQLFVLVAYFSFSAGFSTVITLSIATLFRMPFTNVCDWTSATLCVIRSTLRCMNLPYYFLAMSFVEPDANAACWGESI